MAVKGAAEGVRLPGPADEVDRMARVPFCFEEVSQFLIQFSVGEATEFVAQFDGSGLLQPRRLRVERTIDRIPNLLDIQDVRWVELPAPFEVEFVENSGVCNDDRAFRYPVADHFQPDQMLKVGNCLLFAQFCRADQSPGELHHGDGEKGERGEPTSGQTANHPPQREQREQNHRRNQRHQKPHCAGAAALGGPVVHEVKHEGRQQPDQPEEEPPPADAAEEQGERSERTDHRNEELRHIDPQIVENEGGHKGARLVGERITAPPRCPVGVPMKECQRAVRKCRSRRKTDQQIPPPPLPCEEKRRCRRYQNQQKVGVANSRAVGDQETGDGREQNAEPLLSFRCEGREEGNHSPYEECEAWRMGVLGDGEAGKNRRTDGRRRREQCVPWTEKEAGEHEDSGRRENRAPQGRVKSAARSEHRIHSGGQQRVERRIFRVEFSSVVYHPHRTDEFEFIDRFPVELPLQIEGSCAGVIAVLVGAAGDRHEVVQQGPGVEEEQSAEQNQRKSSGGSEPFEIHSRRPLVAAMT